MTTQPTDLTPAADLAAKNPIRHPNESDEYRRARQELLVEEIELRRHAERVASLRRDLPPGGEVPRTYHFVAEDGADVTLSTCSASTTRWSSTATCSVRSARRRARCARRSWAAWTTRSPTSASASPIAFTARSPIERLIDAKESRGWTDLPVFSDESGDYTRDYVSADDADMPAYNVFTRRDGVIRHFWSDEISGDMADPGQDPRGAVEMDPLWLLLDTTPDGRGTDWYPQLTY